MNTLFKHEFIPTVSDEGIYTEVVYYNFFKFNIQIKAEKVYSGTPVWKYTGTLSIMRDYTWRQVTDNVSIGAVGLTTTTVKSEFENISNRFKEYIKAVYG